MVENEYIACSAIWFDDGNFHEHQPFNIKSGYVICGLRHHNCFSTAYILDPERSYIKHKQIQGFLTNTNNFVDRTKAAEIAYAANQIELEIDRLYSEDLY